MNTRTVIHRGVDSLVIDRAPDWVISDTHFGHANIVRYCQWRSTWAHSIDEHDHRIISEWNRVVAPEDLVLHLGDFALCHEERLSVYRLSLNGRIILARGNHDRSTSAMRRCHMDWVCSHAMIWIGGDSWSCRHDPAMFTLAEAMGNTGLLHGHCHGNGYAKGIPPEIVRKARDCSIDAVQSIGPVRFSDVTRRANGKE